MRYRLNERLPARERAGANGVHPGPCFEAMRAPDTGKARGKQARLLGVAGAVCALALGLAADASARPYLPKRGKLYHGVSDTGETRDFRHFRNQVDAHPAVLQEFFHWDVSLTASGAVNRWKGTDTLGMVSMSTKLPATGKPQIATEYIARGRGDRYILRINEILGQLHQPTYIRLMPEMNGHWNPYCAYNANGTRRGGNHTTHDFKRAWRRFVIIARGGNRLKINKRLRRNNLARIYRAHSNHDPVYQRREVPKVLDKPKIAFGWVPQTSGSPNVSGNQPRDYWPGRNFVDWVGVDIYSAFQGAAFPAMQSFYANWRHLPFMIGEYSPWDGDPGGAFTDRLLDWAEDHRRVRMLVYYRSVTADNEYYISHYPAARSELRRHLNKGRWDQWAAGTRD